jgi:hypothetical protein
LFHPAVPGNIFEGFGNSEKPGQGSIGPGIKRFSVKGRRHMERYDRIFSFIWIVLGISQCVGSIPLGLGEWVEPGTGFMPFVIGLVMIVLGIALFLEASTVLRKDPKIKISVWSEVYWRRVLYVVLLLAAYAAVLPKIGYLIATFLVMVFLLKSGEPVKWISAIMVGILASAISYVIFGVWLNVSFPRGILSF